MSTYGYDIFDSALTTYDVAAEKVESIFTSLDNDPSDLLTKVVARKRKYQYDSLQEKYSDSLPKEAFNSDISVPEIKDVTLTNTYEITTVNEDGIESTLRPIELGQESLVQQVLIPDANVEGLQEYTDSLFDIIGELESQLDSLSVDVKEFPFIVDRELFYKSIWESGFLTLLKEYDLVDGLEQACAKYEIPYDFFTKNQDLILSYIQTKVGNLGFNVPEIMFNTTVTLVTQIKDFNTLEFNRVFDLVSTKLTNSLYENGVELETLEENFTKSVNDLSLVISKALLAAKEAELKVKLDFNSAAIANISKQLNAVKNYIQAVNVVIETEELNLASNQELVNTWSNWVKVVVDKEKNKAQLNDMYFAEFEGLLKEVKAKDEIKRIKSEGQIKTKELQVADIAADKLFEVITNASNLMVYKAKIAFAQSYLKRFRIELETYLRDIQSIYAEYEVKVGMLPAFGNISTEGGRLLGSLLNDSKIKLTTKKG
jgi:hypothetical protein